MVDDAARKFITNAGYEEYQHAVGHQIGRTVHDGSTLLGPRWERYGKTPFGIVEKDNCYTLELGVHVPGYGLVSLEEDVIVTDDGYEWLSKPQPRSSSSRRKPIVSAKRGLWQMLTVPVFNSKFCL